MTFKKVSGIVQIILSFILIGIPVIGLGLLKYAQSQTINLQQTIRGTDMQLGSLLPDIFLGLQWALIIILIIHTLIALSLILQGIVNIKEG